jgi:hypothetical protein
VRAAAGHSAKAPRGFINDANGGDYTDAAALGPAAVELGVAGDYAILAVSAITHVPPSVIAGRIALSPSPGHYAAGFAVTLKGTVWNSPQVGVFSADQDPPTPKTLSTAVKAMLAAYTEAENRPLPDYVDLEKGIIGGLTLRPGLYKWTSDVDVEADVNLSGSSKDVWVFQVSGDLSVAAGKAIRLASGAQPKNVFWQVAGAVKLGAASHAEGVFLSKTSIQLAAGASVTGRLLAQEAVGLDSVRVTAP